MNKIKLLWVVLLAMFSSGLWADNMTTTAGGTTAAGASNAFVLDAGYYYRILNYCSYSANSWANTPYAVYYDASGIKTGKIDKKTTLSDTDLTQLWDISSVSPGYTIKNLSSGTYLNTLPNNSAATLTTTATIQFSMSPFGTYTINSVPYYFWGINGATYQFAWDKTLNYFIGYTTKSVLATGYGYAMTFSKVSKATVDAYYKNLLGANLTLGNSLVTGTIPESAPLGYAAGAKSTLQTAIATAQGIYDAVGSSAYNYSTANTTLASAIATFDAAKIAISSANYNVMVGSNYLVAGASPTTTSDQSAATIFTITTDGTGHCTLMNGANYLQADGTLAATSVPYRFVVNGINFKLNVVSNSANYLTVASNTTFSLADVVTAVKPSLVSYTPSAATEVVTPTTVSVTYNQNIQIANASGITVNGTVTAATVSGRVLTLTLIPVIKTTYVVAISASAIAHADNASLTADAVSYTFTTYSPYLRDKQTMLGSGTFTDGKSYAWFSYGNSNGYLTGGQLACSATDVLSNTLDNSDYSFWIPVLTDAGNKIWAIKNYKTNKYLGYDATSKNLTISETPVSWQISLVDNASATYNNQKYYAIWPSVTDADPVYDYTIKPSTTTIATSVANGTVPSSAFALCPMMSPVDYTNTQVYSESNYITLIVRYAGNGQFYQNGITLSYGTPSSAEYGQWKYKRLANGRYTFQNRVTGDYITYVDDNTVSVLPAGSAGSNEWGMMYNSTSLSPITDWYTVWGAKKALYGAASPLTALGTSNGLNSGTAAYMIRPVITAVAYSAWNGTGNWSVTGSWSNAALPGASSDMLIQSGTVSLNQDLDASGSVLRIYSGAQLTVNAGKKLTVGANTFTNNGTFTLSSDDTNGTATFVNTDATAKSISATVNQNLTTGRNWYVSSPVTTAPYTALSTATNVQYWNETIGNWDVKSTGTLDPGKGYISVSTTSTANVVFSGTLNDGNITVNLTRTHGVTKSGFNLVGNPYPSYLSWDDVVKTNVGTTIWYRSKAGRAYKFATYNTTGHIGTNLGSTSDSVVTKNIPPMQAFWVRVNAPVIATNDTVGSLQFTNNMRAHKTTQAQGDGNTYNDGLLRAKAVEAVQVLRLQVSNGTNSDEAIVLFNANAQNGLDDYDSYKMSNGSASVPEIYTTVGASNLVINGLNSVETANVLPLGFTTGQTNTFTIKASQVSNFEGYAIFLRDNKLGTEADLTNGDSYTFTSDAITTNSRFTVVFKSASVTTGVTNATLANVHVSSNQKGQIVVSTSEEFGANDQISVYNSVGQKLVSEPLTHSRTILNHSFTSGVYLFSLNVSAENRTEKVIVK